MILTRVSVTNKLRISIDLDLDRREIRSIKSSGTFSGRNESIRFVNLFRTMCCCMKLKLKYLNLDAFQNSKKDLLPREIEINLVITS